MLPVEENVEKTDCDVELYTDDIRCPNDDPNQNPHNWSKARKLVVISIACVLVANTTMGISLASGGAVPTLETFGLANNFGWRVLPVSLYLAGYSIGSTVQAPMSEHYGRRPVNLTTIFLSMIFRMACALAPNWAAFNIFRLLDGFFSAGSTSIIGGICADLYANDISRGRAFLGYNMMNTIGSVIGPIISGFAVIDSWRLVYWCGMAISGVCFLVVLFGMPETHHHTIEKSNWKKDPTAFSQDLKEHRHVSTRDFVSRVLLKPLLMLCTEPLVFFPCIYIAFQYSLLYIFLQSYPIIFEDLYKFSKGEEGLTFIGFAIGVLAVPPLSFMFERYYSRAASRGCSWTRHHGAKRLPPACASGPLIAIGLFWSAWTSRRSIHWISPALASIPYGIGYTLNLNSLSNYIVDGYASHAASANAASSLTRQLMGAALPFAAAPIYRALGIQWATNLLGFLAAASCLIPFVFWFYGQKLLGRSKWAQTLAGGQLQLPTETLDPG